MVYMILANGFEDIEAIVTLDILRRGGVNIKTLSLHNQHVISSSGIEMKTDGHIEEFSPLDCEMLILPGGGAGTVNLENSIELRDILESFHGQYKIAAICAAPRVLGKLGLLHDKKVTAYPGNEDYLEGAFYQETDVVIDDPFITACGPGVSFSFAFTLLSKLKGREVMEKVYKSMLMEHAKPSLE